MKKLKLKALDLGANEILTREQLKNVMGGDGSGGGSGGSGGGCPNVNCFVVDGSMRYAGHCGYYVPGNQDTCECVTNLGPYIPKNDVSHCNP